MESYIGDAPNLVLCNFFDRRIFCCDWIYDVVEGGLGAIGSLKGLAQELNERLQVGVLEALQSKYFIEELIEELYSQIQNNCSGKVSLLGRSWGAWLAALFAEKNPELIENKRRTAQSFSKYLEQNIFDTGRV